MRHIVTVFLVVMAAADVCAACSKSRADVKQLKDAAAQNIPTAVASTRMSDLMAVPRPSAAELKGAEHQRLASEQRLVVVEAKVVKSNFEPDGDIKLHLADPADASKMMLVEVPEPKCMSPQYRTLVAQVRADLKRLVQQTGDAHPVLKFTGVPFWGFVREKETAPNGIQLHPILKVEASQP
jgi:hypothetical protein